MSKISDFIKWSWCHNNTPNCYLEIQARRAVPKLMMDALVAEHPKRRKLSTDKLLGILDEQGYLEKTTIRQVLEVARKVASQEMKWPEAVSDVEVLINA